MRIWPLVAVLLAGAGGAARANGRYPQTRAVFFQPGNDQKIWVGATFGLIYSPDDGQTWVWTCEQALGYTGVFDPVYAVSAAGTIFETLPDGLRISRDEGCSFEPSATFSGTYTSSVQIGGDGAVWVSTQATAGANDVWVSRNDGATFEPTGLPSDRTFYGSLRVAPSDPNRVYVAGYTMPVTGSPAPIFYRTDDGAGAGGWMEIPFGPSTSSQLAVVGVSNADPDVVFVRVREGSTDFVYRSDDGGVGWAQVAGFVDGVTGFVSSGDGMTIAVSSGSDGTRISHDGGMVFEPLSGAPQLVGCAAARPADGDVFFCADNWQPDSMALSRTDLASFTRVFRFVDLGAVLECPNTSPVAAQCDSMWCLVCNVVGCPDPACFAPDDPVDAAGGGGGGGDGCGCGVALGLGLVLAGGGARRRRRGP